MKNGIKAVHVGFGSMGKVITQYLFEKNVDVIGVFNRESNISRDISNDIKYGKGIKIRPISELHNFLKTTKPDVCTVSTATSMADLKDVLLTCAHNGVNAITIAEEAIFPWESASEITKEIDQAAKKNNCTISGSGCQDIFWGVIPCILATTVHKVEKLVVFSRYGLNGCGSLIFDDHGCGISVQKFHEKFCKCNFMSPQEQVLAVKNGTVKPSLMWMMNDWICSKLDLHPISKKQTIEPIVNDFPVYMQANKKWVEAGDASGLKATVTTETKESVTI